MSDTERDIAALKAAAFSIAAKAGTGEAIKAVERVLGSLRDLQWNGK